MTNDSCLDQDNKGLAMHHPRSDVFVKTYQEYLRQIREIDFLEKADILGLEKIEDSLKIPLYDSLYWFSQKGLTADEGAEIPVALQVIICKYILTSSLTPVMSENTLQPYRDFKDAAPLISYFNTNTTLRLEKVFAGRVAELEKRCVECGGEKMESSVYDLSFRFYALPRIPVIVNFNDSDEMFSAACSVLYNSSAANYLDMECLSMTGTHLASILTCEDSL